MLLKYSTVKAEQETVEGSTYVTHVVTSQRLICCFVTQWGKICCPSVCNRWPVLQNSSWWDDPRGKVRNKRKTKKQFCVLLLVFLPSENQFNNLLFRYEHDKREKLYQWKNIIDRIDELLNRLMEKLNRLKSTDPERYDDIKEHKEIAEVFEDINPWNKN